MAEIELVVKLPESIWVAIQNGEYCGILDDRTYNVIKNGTPLEKHDEEVIKETVESIWGKPPYTELLDKIRADIDEQIKYNTYFNSDMAKGEIIAFEWVKRKIDEYGKEQE